MITYEQFSILMEYHAKVNYSDYSYEFDDLNIFLEYSFSLYSKSYKGKFYFTEFENKCYYLVKAKITQKLKMVDGVKFNHTPRKIKIGDFLIYNGIQPYVTIHNDGQMYLGVKQ